LKANKEKNDSETIRLEKIIKKPTKPQESTNEKREEMLSVFTMLCKNQQHQILFE
jgi:hypothetical protein